MAGDLAKQCILDGAELIIAAGGDGTINEVANGMVYSQVPLAILPGGTANCMAVELGFGTRMNRAIQKLSQCAPERISVGRLRNDEGERFFLLMAGVGLDAQIVYTVQAGLKSVTGKAAYWIGGASALTRPLAQFRTRIGMRSLETGFALASRVKNYGGDLSIATGASLLEDDFEVVLFEGRNPVRYWGYFIGVITRTLPKFKGITVERARRLDFTSPEDRRIYVQVDGEYAGRLPVTVDIVEDALTLMVPSDFRERLGVKVTEALLPAAG
jgi:diacylglycerol kinase family enzyme